MEVFISSEWSSSNYVVWECGPRSVFVGLHTLMIAPLDAVLSFSDASVAFANIFEIMIEAWLQHSQSAERS